jgi:hypothetical protein
MVLQLARLCLDSSPQSCVEPGGLVYSKQFIKLFNHNGLAYALKYFKECRQAIYKYTSGDPVYSSSMVSLTKDGIPVFLQDWIPLIRLKDKTSIRAVLSILQIGRLFTGVGMLDTSNITKDYTGLETEKVIPDHVIESFVNEMNLRIDEIPEPDFYLRSSKGPSGPAMASICKEAKDLDERLYNLIIKFLTSEQKEILDQMRDENIHNPPDLQQLCDSTNIVRKITVVADKEGKNRVIAILDYWSQLVLKPLHQQLMLKVGGLKQDGTYDQVGVVHKLRKGDMYYSMDLTSATDRLPRKLQERLLSKILGSDGIARDYMSILTDFPFTTRDGETINYSVGQPMGAYAS